MCTDRHKKSPVFIILRNTKEEIMRDDFIGETLVGLLNKWRECFFFLEECDVLV